MSEIFKTYLNAGISLTPLYFYRDKEKNEINLIIDKEGVLYPIEIKMSGNPTKAMAKSFHLLDKISDKKRGLGVILCQYENKLYLSEDVISLPIEYI